MNQEIKSLLFSALRSSVCEAELPNDEKKPLDIELLPKAFALAKQHDLAHLFALGLKKSFLVDDDTAKKLDDELYRAVCRYEQKNYELLRVCDLLEKAEIPFIPLKGSVLRKYYPEPWMRSSCDIDILVHGDELEKTISCLSESLHYVEKERATHDVSLFSPGGVHVEIHFDLVEENRANNAINILSGVWDNVSLCDGCNYRYEMSDEFFYFYHIAHMAKHFENGGCGIRPFLDLFILDRESNENTEKRDALLERGGLLKFAQSARRQSRVWFGGEPSDELSERLSDFILSGGGFGTADNRVAVNQKNGGKIKYILSRMFVPYARLKRYYPILEKHKYLTPLMQIRRWFMLLRPDIRGMAKREISVNGKISNDKVKSTHDLLCDIGLR